MGGLKEKSFNKANTIPIDGQLKSKIELSQPTTLCSLCQDDSCGDGHVEALHLLSGLKTRGQRAAEAGFLLNKSGKAL